MPTRSAIKFFSSLGLCRMFLMKDNRPEQISFVVYALVALLALANIAYTFLFSRVMMHELSSGWGEILFIANILAAHAAALYLLFRFIKQLSKSFTMKYVANITSSYTQTYFKKMYLALILAEFTIIGIFLVIIFQIAFSSSYHIGLIIPIMAISFILATVIMSLLSLRLFQWYRVTRNFSLLLYTSIAFLLAVGIGAMTASNIAIIFLQQEHIEEVITPATQLQSSLQPSFLPERSSSSSSSSSTALYDLRSLQVVVTPLRIGYILLWFTSVLFLRHYSKRVGEVKFWIIISLPLLSFLIGVYLLSAVDSSSSMDSQEEEEEQQQSSSKLLLYILLVVASVIAGAILFGMMFLSVAKSMHKVKSTATSALANYLSVSAYGIIILPESLTSPFIDLTAYPPYSAIAWSLAAFACYLFSFGFYASSISLSHNRDLRRAIRKSALEQSSKLLDNIGVGEMQQQLQDKVMNIVKAKAKKIEHQTGIQSSFSEEEAKEYLQQVLEEIKTSKSKS
jgi:flagellar basal body-associated protein FliL